MNMKRTCKTMQGMCAWCLAMDQSPTQGVFPACSQCSCDLKISHNPGQIEAATEGEGMKEFIASIACNRTVQGQK